MEVYRRSRIYWYDSPTHSGGIELELTQPQDAGPPEGYDDFLASLNKPIDEPFSPGHKDRIRQQLGVCFKKEYMPDPPSHKEYTPEASSSKENRVTTPTSRRSGTPRFTSRPKRSATEEKKEPDLNDSLDDDIESLVMCGSQAIDRFKKEEQLKQQASRIQQPRPILVLSKPPPKKQAIVISKPTSTYSKQEVAFKAPVAPQTLSTVSRVQKPQNTGSNGSTIADNTSKNLPARKTLTILPNSNAVPDKTIQKAPIVSRHPHLFISSQYKPPTKHKTPTRTGTPKTPNSAVRKTISFEAFSRQKEEKKNNALARARSIDQDDDFYDDSWLSGFQLPNSN